MGSIEPRWPMACRVWHLAELLDRMVGRLGVTSVAARLDEGYGLLEARTRCHDCVAVAQCEAWLSVSAVEPAILGFCPNAAYLERCRGASRATEEPSRPRLP
jgi:hypothetical protein